MYSESKARKRSNMSFDAASLFLSFIPSGIGFVLFVYGRKQARWPHLVAGLLLMVYPYFTPTPTAMIATGAVIGLGFWFALRYES